MRVFHNVAQQFAGAAIKNEVHVIRRLLSVVLDFKVEPKTVSAEQMLPQPAKSCLQSKLMDRW
jgi:hypothetical protein